MKLRISDDLLLPPEVVTATQVIYGGKGMGKTNFGSVLVEEMTKADLRWSVLDPLGVWWGLRHSPDGKGRGIECLILGGVHGDIPIEPTAGAVVADLVVDERVNTIIDFSRNSSGIMWSKADRIRFVTDYATRLFERQGSLVEGRRREPLHQVVDEAARYIPQIIPHGSADLAKCVGAWETFVEEGRNVGLGVSFLTQRSARMNKSVSELADVMYAFRTVGPNSLEAVTDWLGDHVDKARVRDLSGKVRELEVGQALVVSPGWLKQEKIARIRQRETFDSSATPKPGQQPKRVTGKGAKPDLIAYQERMAATIERASESDPRELRNKLSKANHTIRGLEDQLASKMSDPDVKALLEEEYARGYGDAEAQLASTATARFNDWAHSAKPKLLELASALRRTADGIEAIELEVPEPINTAIVADRPLLRRPVVPPSYARPEIAAPARRAPPNDVPAGDVNPSERQILDALAFMKSIGSPTKKQNLAFFAGYTVAGRFNSLLGGLRGKGLITYPEPGAVDFTPSGEAIGDASAADIRSLADLHNAWLSKLSESEAKVLRVVLRHHPGELSKAELAAESDYEIAGRFNNLLGKLRSLGAITYPHPGYVVASEALYPRGLR